MDRPQIIVLTPVRNEAWILRRFLKCTSLWADQIIIADQMSEDDPRAIAQAFPKVTVVENPHREYSEVARQRLLIEAARRIPGPRVLMALDADEIMSANILDSEEWRTALRAPPGTVLCFAKVDLFNSPAHYFLHSAEDGAHGCHSLTWTTAQRTKERLYIPLAYLSTDLYRRFV